MVTPLPIIPLATFNVEDQDIPGGSVKLKPFTLGLESILLQAKGLGDNIKIDDAVKAVHQVIDECAVDASFKAEQLPSWVVELLFIRLRQHSIGEVVQLSYVCKEDVDGKPCNNKLSFDLDLRELEVQRDGYKNRFVVYDDPEAPIAVQFKHVKMDLATKNYPTDAHMLADHIELISHGDEVMKASDYTPENLLAFVKGIPHKAKMDINANYIIKLPTVKKDIELKCKCGAHHKIGLKGLGDFFG